MSSVRLVLIGGFLGAGKTTLIGRLGALFTKRGLRVGVVTNDQASNLVDTRSLQAQGYAVREVPDSCFCCALPKLVDAMTGLVQTGPVDLVLGEPVGSCTDLAATVIEPLRRFDSALCTPAPLVVLVDPARARTILAEPGRGGFAADAAYIYEKQLEEADIIALNKVDLLAPDEVASLSAILSTRFPQARVLSISARTGAGLAELVESLDARPDQKPGRHIAEVDYDVYAAGEAALGWLNAELAATRAEPFALDELALGLLDQIGSELRAAGCDVAHLKVLAQGSGHEAVANLTGHFAAPVLSRASGCSSNRAQVLVNARVFCDPQTLRELVERGAERYATICGIALSWTALRSLQPGRPVPTHRFAEAL